MKVRPNDLEISAGLARELYRKATEAGTDRTSVCMGMLGHPVHGKGPSWLLASEHDPCTKGHDSQAAHHKRDYESVAHSGLTPTAPIPDTAMGNRGLPSLTGRN